MPLEVSDPAPAVEAEDQRGNRVSLDYDAPTVVYFYPRDDTPGCTTEARQFTREHDAYRDAGVEVFGVSLDDVDSHAAFAEKHDIEIPLLADPDGEIASAFGVSTGNGRTPRTTFVIVDGEIARVYTGVTADGHAREVLADLLEGGVVTLPED